MPPSRWFAVGSAGGSPPRAGARAAGDALVHDDAKLLVVFCARSHDPPGELARTRGMRGVHNQTLVVPSIA
jgi:hypothetical protein